MRAQTVEGLVIDVRTLAFPLSENRGFWRILSGGVAWSDSSFNMISLAAVWRINWGKPGYNQLGGH